PRRIGTESKGNPYSRRSPIASTTKNHSKKRSPSASTNSKSNRTGSKALTSRHSNTTSHCSTSASKLRWPRTQCEAQCTPTRSLRSGKSPKSHSEANSPSNKSYSDSKQSKNSAMSQP